MSALNKKLYLYACLYPGLTFLLKDHCCINLLFLLKKKKEVLVECVIKKQAQTQQKNTNIPLNC